MIAWQGEDLNTESFPADNLGDQTVVKTAK